MTDLLRAYFEPDKHAQEIPIELIVTDDKVDEDYVGSLSKGVEDPKAMRAIVVIRHPREEIYAVLDGHHRYRLHREKGCTTIRASVVDDYVGLGFYLTKKGMFQPTPAFTKFVRIPLKRFVAWMTEFLKDPRGMLDRTPKVEESECNPDE